MPYVKAVGQFLHGYHELTSIVVGWIEASTAVAVMYINSTILTRYLIKWATAQVNI